MKRRIMIDRALALILTLLALGASVCMDDIRPTRRKVRPPDRKSILKMGTGVLLTMTTITFSASMVTLIW